MQGDEFSRFGRGSRLCFIGALEDRVIGGSRYPRIVIGKVRICVVMFRDPWCGDRRQYISGTGTSVGRNRGWPAPNLVEI